MYSYCKSPVAPHRRELYFSNQLPEPGLVVNVRVFVFSPAHHLLFIQQPDGTWDLPGGGCEPAEDPRQTAYREVAEEAGVTIEALEWLAYEKLQVLGPEPAAYRWPYPIAYSAYAVARVAALAPFTASLEAVARCFLPVSKAVDQDGILFGNRHIILDKLLAAGATRSSASG